MRKVTNNAVNAFLSNRAFAEGNTSVSPANNDNYLYLHGNIIAIRNKQTGALRITNAGWFSNTTKERLNALPGVFIQQKKGVWYLNGQEWDGTLIDVAETQMAISDKVYSY